MKQKRLELENIIASVPDAAWRSEMEKTRRRYHVIGAWAAIIFDPIFAVTDYFNIPDSWQVVFYLRLGVSVITFMTLFLWSKRRFGSHIIVIVPFTLISLQNAFTYSVIGAEDLLGHNLNYIALLIGAAMFLAWEWQFSVAALVLSAIATAYFITGNESIAMNEFFVNGGLLLMAVGIFMFMLIQTRYNLTVRETKARLALELSNEEIKARNLEIQEQAAKIAAINSNLEQLVHERTLEVERKRKALDEYAYINAHELRSPVASILGLIHLVSKLKLDSEAKEIVEHLDRSTRALDAVVRVITKAIERGD